MYQYMFKIKNKIKFTIARKKYCLDEIFWYHSIALEISKMMVSILLIKEIWALRFFGKNEEEWIYFVF